MIDYCCEDMKNNCFVSSYGKSNNLKECADKCIIYVPCVNEYGVPIYDGENLTSPSFINIRYCPWCGKKLSNSLRKKWFAELEFLGFDAPFFEENIPEKYKSSEWWQAQ